MASNFKIVFLQEIGIVVVQREEVLYVHTTHTRTHGHTVVQALGKKTSFVALIKVEELKEATVTDLIPINILNNCLHLSSFLACEILVSSCFVQAYFML